MSILMSGNNSLSYDLRYLTCAEIFTNTEYHYATKIRICLPNTISCLIFLYLLFFLKLAQEFPCWLKRKVNLLQRTTRFPFLCILALSTVIKRPITSVYPDFGSLKFRKVFNCQNFPRVENSGDSPFQKLFCNMSKVPVNPHFLSNHFVPLVNRKKKIKVERNVNIIKFLNRQKKIFPRFLSPNL